jgi:hypothetical protein
MPFVRQADLCNAALGASARFCRVASADWRPGRVYFLTLLEPLAGTTGLWPLPPGRPVPATVGELSTTVDWFYRPCRVVGGWLGIRPHAVRTLPASDIGHAAGMQDHSGSQTPKPPPAAQPAAGPGAMSGVSPGGTLPASLAKSAIALRSATPADAEFCYRLHTAAMGDYITAAWGWDEQVQPAFHDRAFNPHRWQIMTAGQASIGTLDIDCRPGEIDPAISASASAAGSSGRSWREQSAQARTWFSTC